MFVAEYILGKRIDERGSNITNISTSLVITNLCQKILNINSLDTSAVLRLPDYNLLSEGWTIFIYNIGSIKFTINDPMNQSIQILYPDEHCKITLHNITNEIWKINYYKPNDVISLLSNGGQSIIAGGTNITFDQIITTTNCYSFTAGQFEVLINKVGTYKIIFQFTVGISVGLVGGACEAYIMRKPNGGAYSEVPGSRSVNGVSLINLRAGTTSIILVVNLDELDTIKVMAQRTISTSTFLTGNNINRLLIERI
jgi:hypothetical protein